jgi:lipopolysaccharide export LptBFGC system permease protein LptF
VAGCSRLTCDITPTSLEAHALGLAGMGSGDLWELRNDTAARVELWQRLVPPLANLILMLVGLPLAVAGSARGGRIMPLVMALMLGALYVLAGEVGAQAARSGELLNFLERFRGGDWLAAMGGPIRLAVDLAMGLPHLVFLAVGTLLYWRVDR